jgi:hypothetical protein
MGACMHRKRPPSPIKFDGLRRNEAGTIVNKQRPRDPVARDVANKQPAKTYLDTK